MNHFRYGEIFRFPMELVEKSSKRRLPVPLTEPLTDDDPS